MMLQIDFFLLNAVAFISLDKTSSCKSFLAIFLHDLELIISFASFWGTLVLGVAGNFEIDFFSTFNLFLKPFRFATQSLFVFF